MYHLAQHATSEVNVNLNLRLKRVPPLGFLGTVLVDCLTFLHAAWNYLSQSVTVRARTGLN